MSAGKSEVRTSLDCVATDGCKATVQQYIPTSSHGGMRPILPSDNPDVWVKHSDYAALESLLLDARATGLKLMGDLQRAEALAGERLALLEQAKSLAISHLGLLIINGIQDGMLETKQLIDAIDAVGGRGED